MTSLGNLSQGYCTPHGLRLNSSFQLNYIGEPCIVRDYLD